MIIPYLVDHQDWCLWENHQVCCHLDSHVAEICDCGAAEVQTLLDDRAALIAEQETKLDAVRKVLDRLRREATYIAATEGDLCQYDRGRLDMRRLAIARLHRALGELTFTDATARIEQALTDPAKAAGVAAVRAEMTHEDQP